MKFGPYKVGRSHVVWHLVIQHVYTMLITNNRTSDHLWRKEHLVKHASLKLLSHIVGFNAIAFIDHCLEYVGLQSFPDQTFPV